MFKLGGGPGFLLAEESFNLLSEILFVQAKKDQADHVKQKTFQSLERDSVCSSNSQPNTIRRRNTRFNLLSEILFVQAASDFYLYRVFCAFQSLERDSVCSSDDAISGFGGASDSFNLLSEILFVQAKAPVHSPLSVS